jgi:hypothetical protein
MAKTKEVSLNASVSNAINGKHDLDRFKKGKNLGGVSVKFKDQAWIPLSNAFREAVSVPGIPTGHVTLLRGHSDTGKTTALLEAAVNAQKMGILPVFIITEMKWSWEHAKMMGLQVEDVVDVETGEVIDYKGFFIYTDRSSMNTIEDVAAFINDLLDEQKKGNLPYDLCFFWDSIGSVPCKMSVEKSSNNNEWNAGAMSVQFGNFINQRILLSRKTNNPYTNTLVAINKVWVAKPSMPMEQPRMKNKGGDTMWFDATIIITFGNITNQGTSKIKAIKGGKDVTFAKRTKIHVEKNHISGVDTKGNIIMTPHGFIQDDKKALDKYKKEHSDEWLKILGGTGDFQIEIESEMKEDIRDIFDNSNE